METPDAFRPAVVPVCGTRYGPHPRGRSSDAVGNAWVLEFNYGDARAIRMQFARRREIMFTCLYNVLSFLSQGISTRDHIKLLYMHIICNLSIEYYAVLSSIINGTLHWRRVWSLNCFSDL